MIPPKAKIPSRPHETDARVRNARCGKWSPSFTPTIMASAPLVIIADVPPNHAANGACALMVRAATEICPGSPHSVKNKEAKQTKAPRHQTASTILESGGSFGSSNQIRRAERKNAAALIRSVQRELSCTISLPSRTAASIFSENAEINALNTTDERYRSESELTA